jgi:putative inorganic carbon (hco3(-)) transporter
MSNNQSFLDYDPVAPSRLGRTSEGEAARDVSSAPGRLPEPAPARASGGARGGRARQSQPEAAVAKTWWGGGILRRGHALSYAGVFLFTAVLLFRPYELFPALSFLSTSAYWLALLTLLIYLPSQFALEGNVSAGLREVYVILLLCLAGLLSIPLARNPGEAWDTFNDTFIKAVVIFIVTVNVVRTDRRLRGLIYLSLGVTILLSVAAVRDYSTGNLPVEGYRIRGMLGGLFGNPNDLALHLVTMTPLFVAMMMSSRNPLGKVVYGAGAVLSVIANVVTFSRAGFLGLLGMAVVLLWKLGRGKRFKVSVVGALCLTLFITLAPGSYGVRVLSIFIPGLDPVGSSDHRRGILDRAVLVSLRNPVVGIGMGNFHIVSLGETVSHNAYTQVAAEMGIAALVLYLMLIVAALRRLKRIELHAFTPRRRSRYFYLAVGLQASIVGYMISSFFASVAYQWYVYYLAAYAICLSRIYEAQQSALGRDVAADDSGDVTGRGARLVGATQPERVGGG